MNINDSIRTLDPGSFYALVELIKSIDTPEIQDGIRSSIILLTAGKMEIERQQDILAKSNSSLTREVRLTTRRNNFKPLEDQEQEDRHLMPTLTGQNFVGLLYQMTAEIWW